MVLYVYSPVTYSADHWDAHLWQIHCAETTRSSPICISPPNQEHSAKIHVLSSLAHFLLATVSLISQKLPGMSVKWGPHQNGGGWLRNVECDSYSITTIYEWGWILEPSVMRLEWRKCTNSGSSTYYTPSLMSSISISGDTSKNQYSLHLNYVTTKKKVFCYCARDTVREIRPSADTNLASATQKGLGCRGFSGPPGDAQDETAQVQPQEQIHKGLRKRLPGGHQWFF